MFILGLLLFENYNRLSHFNKKTKNFETKNILCKTFYSHTAWYLPELKLPYAPLTSTYAIVLCSSCFYLVLLCLFSFCQTNFEKFRFGIDRKSLFVFKRNNMLNFIVCFEKFYFLSWNFLNKPQPYVGLIAVSKKHDFIVYGIKYLSFRLNNLNFYYTFYL